MSGYNLTTFGLTTAISDWLSLLVTLGIGRYNWLWSIRTWSNWTLPIGCIDCTHVRIKCPNQEQAMLYVNRKGFYSINVQVVCDAQRRILDIIARWRGSVHDSRIWDSSRLKEEFEVKLQLCTFCALIMMISNTQQTPNNSYITVSYNFLLNNITVT